MYSRGIFTLCIEVWLWAIPKVVANGGGGVLCVFLNSELYIPPWCKTFILPFVLPKDRVMLFVGDFCSKAREVGWHSPLLREQWNNGNQVGDTITFPKRCIIIIRCKRQLHK